MLANTQRRYLFFNKNRKIRFDSQLLYCLQVTKLNLFDRKIRISLDLLCRISVRIIENEFQDEYTSKNLIVYSTMN